MVEQNARLPGNDCPQGKECEEKNENFTGCVDVIFYAGWLYASIEVAAPKEPITINMNVKIELRSSSRQTKMSKSCLKLVAIFLR